MSSIHEIADAVRGLSLDDLATFRQWFAEFIARVWDDQFESDADSGRLDKKEPDQ